MTTFQYRAGRLDAEILTGLFSAINGGINQGQAPTISFAAVDSTHVRATFAAAVLDGPAIRCIDLWQLENGAPITVLEVIPEQTPATTSVLLTTTEHLQGAAYIGTLHFLELA